VLENKFLRNLIEEFLEVCLWNSSHFTMLSLDTNCANSHPVNFCRFLIQRSYCPVKMVKNLS
jgi:hypothetical protein